MRYSVALDVEHMLYVDGREHSKATQVSPCRELSSVLFIDLLTIHDHVRQAGDASSRGAWLCWVVCLIFRRVAALEPPLLVARFSSPKNHNWTPDVQSQYLQQLLHPPLLVTTHISRS